MKIAILTLPFHANYGGILQAYALQKVLRDKGHDVVMAQGEVYSTRYSKKRWPLFWAMRIAPQLMTKIVPRLKGEYVRNPRDFIVARRNLREFVYSNMNIGPLLNEHNINGLDVAIVGSDQVWRPQYGNIDYFTLGFMKNWKGRKIAYAASFGTDDVNFTANEKQSFQSNVRTFNCVSVREHSGISICTNLCGIETYQVLDPTLLLSRKEYESLITKNYQHKGLYYYVLDATKELMEKIYCLAKDLQLPNYTVSPKAGIDGNWNRREITREMLYIPEVEEWIDGFISAQYVVTDSFHGTVFSILFHRPFLTIVNKGRGEERVKALLNQIGLSDRLINNPEEISKARIVNPINWVQVDNRIDNLKEKSLTFLFNGLKI
ncbi:MAG: polysaccharide pyruvyl transferase family protein [Bacteroidales bacterium]|nr:polysaccharide pyruvyl transferase family protein [Bacteroidales bacterium]